MLLLLLLLKFQLSDYALLINPFSFNFYFYICSISLSLVIFICNHTSTNQCSKLHTCINKCLSGCERFYNTYFNKTKDINDFSLFYPSLFTNVRATEFSSFFCKFLAECSLIFACAFISCLSNFHFYFFLHIIIIIATSLNQLKIGCFIFLLLFLLLFVPKRVTICMYVSFKFPI